VLLDKGSKILLGNDYAYYIHPSTQFMGRFFAVLIFISLCGILSEIPQLLDKEVRYAFNELLPWILVLAFFMLIYYFLPSAWGRLSRYFFVNYRGVYFPKTLSQRNKSEWLLVPWSRVEQIKAKTVIKDYMGGDGDQSVDVLSIKLLLTANERRWIVHSKSGFESGIEWILDIEADDICKDKHYDKVTYDLAKDDPYGAAMVLNELKANYA